MCTRSDIFSYINPPHHRKRLRLYPNAVKHKFFQLPSMHCSKYCRKKKSQRRKIHAWRLCRGRWQMIKFNLRWRSLWFGLLWREIWRCKKVRHIHLFSSFLFLHYYVLNRPYCSLTLPPTDRELCESENDMPWGIQMCMVSPVTTMMIFKLISYRLHSIVIIHQFHDCILFYNHRMTHLPSNKFIVHNRF